jgi:hypothetical protein
MAKKALLVGINHYPNPENNLKGCINDVLLMSKILQEQYGFDDINNLRVLTDERALTADIRTRLQWLVDGAVAGDTLVFHYSGHGSQVRDRDGDELKDGLDEIICPYDLDWDHPFTDDDFYNIFKGVKPGVNLTVVLDCCHSGSGLREMVAPDLRRPQPAIPHRDKFLTPPPDILHRTQPMIEDMGTNRTLTMTKPKKELKTRHLVTQSSGSNAILIAGCRSNQTSADAWINNDYHGALTWYLYQTLSAANFKLSYATLIHGVQAKLKHEHYQQVPQLEGPASYVGKPVFEPFA